MLASSYDEDMHKNSWNFSDVFLMESWDDFVAILGRSLDLGKLYSVEITLRSSRSTNKSLKNKQDFGGFDRIYFTACAKMTTKMSQMKFLTSSRALNIVANATWASENYVNLIFLAIHVPLPFEPTKRVTLQIQTAIHAHSSKLIRWVTATHFSCLAAG